MSISAATGEIIGLDIWYGSPPGRYSGMPAFTKAQAQAIAERVARQLLPEKFARCKLVSSWPFEEPIIFALKDRTYPVVYTFTFARTVKGIPVSGNEIRVGINAETGKMQHFSVNWEDNLDVPDPSGHIAADRAAAIFAEQGLELAYVYYGPRDRDTGVRPKLVYQLKGGNFILDAFTGKVLDHREGPYYFDIGGPGGGEPMYSRAKQEASLRPRTDGSGPTTGSPAAKCWRGWSLPPAGTATGPWPRRTISSLSNAPAPWGLSPPARISGRLPR